MDKIMTLKVYDSKINQAGDVKHIEIINGQVTLCAVKYPERKYLKWYIRSSSSLVFSESHQPYMFVDSKIYEDFAEDIQIIN